MFNWKKRYFKNKARAVEKMILDLEFKRFKTFEIREEVRQEYDNKKAQIPVLDERIANEKITPTMSVDEAKRLDDQKVLLEIDIKRHEDQLIALDAEVAGQAPTNDQPEGIQGINAQLNGLRELKEMVIDYIKQL